MISGVPTKPEIQARFDECGGHRDNAFGVRALYRHWAFRAVHVDPGMKQLEFRYEPRSWRQGWLAAGIGCLLGLGWFLSLRR